MPCVPFNQSGLHVHKNKGKVAAKPLEIRAAALEVPIGRWVFTGGGSMRRTDREVTDSNEILGWLREVPVGRLAFADATEPYIVPLNFGILNTSPLTLVFHCATTGRKLDMMFRNPRVCFEADLPGDLRGGGTMACRWGMAFRSVIAWGHLEQVHDEKEKKAALEALMGKYSSNRDWAFDTDRFSFVVVLKLTIEEITAKQNR
jgi:nitroimidazol reductase NimA-like FMN-containing flavoprotein (pyridoxamine 5'-phosphate oxidase superfamily)